MENTETFKKIYSCIQFMSANFGLLTPIVDKIGKMLCEGPAFCVVTPFPVVGMEGFGPTTVVTSCDRTLGSVFFVCLAVLLLCGHARQSWVSASLVSQHNCLF